MRRWGVVDLLDALKEVDWLTGFTEELTTVASAGDCGAPARLASAARTSARAIIRVLNATFAERDSQRWGNATSVASDSQRFGSWNSNLVTKWHAR